MTELQLVGLPDKKNLNFRRLEQNLVEKLEMLRSEKERVTKTIVQRIKQETADKE